MFNQLCTLLAFIFAVILLPGLGICYLAVRICRWAWLHVLSVVHPDVNFIKDTTIRTLVDTIRNQGIFTVLLRVEGEPRVDLVRRHLHDIVTCVDKLGNPRFPKLSMLLVSRWGSYAWKRPSAGKEFSVDQVLVVGGRSTHRGRPLTELNVREHVSDIVTRYLPRGAPPWQLVVLPCAGSESHYLLLRMHHLLLTDGDVNIADILPLATTPDTLDGATAFRYHLDSPLINVLERPEHVHSLYEALIENLTNRWNEFTSNYDPLNRPELLKTTPKFCGFLAAVAVAVVAIVRRLWYGYGYVSPDTESWLKYARTSIRHELTARAISMHTLFKSILASAHPWNIITSNLNFVYWLLVMCVWRAPAQTLNELGAMYRRVTSSDSPYGMCSTLTDFICDCTPLIYRAAHQVLRWIVAGYSAPRLVADELLLSRSWPGGMPVPLCGRKVVSWSKPVNGERLRDISLATGLSCTEVLLTAIGGVLTDYYTASGSNPPEQVPVTARRISSRYLFSHGPNVRPQDAVSGMLCLRIPTVKDDTAYVRNLSNIGKCVAAARQEQPFVYLMSVLQTKHRIVTRALPSVAVAVILKYLSKKYTVSVTELMAGDGIDETRHTTWGKRVTDIIYWRPPQANISISLCLNYYGDEVTLAVMSDALLSPHHVPLAERLPDHVEAIAKAVAI